MIGVVDRSTCFSEKAWFGDTLRATYSEIDVTYEEEDWVDEEETSHRGPDE